MGRAHRPGTAGAGDGQNGRSPRRGREVNTDTDWYPSAIDNHGRVVGERTYDHQDLAAETYWDAPYTKHRAQTPGLPAHEGKGWLNDISPSSGVAVGAAMFPHGIPPITPVDQAQIWPGSGPMRPLPSLAPDGPAGAEAVNDQARAGGLGLRRRPVRRRRCPALGDLDMRAGLRAVP
ncbi:hypothetical protein [Streptomyces lydicus]|uniref:hypothetical protein n=1 Tax=Streptomyces lydicus TaxID=47763 RepID=UPI0028700833|nr:hypothetical protein [Streptomyces lydicus]